MISWWIKSCFYESTSSEKSFVISLKKCLRKKNIFQDDLLASVEERFNGFDIVRRLTENEQTELYTSTDIVYKPVS